jgi:hypothetical protein
MRGLADIAQINRDADRQRKEREARITAAQPAKAVIADQQLAHIARAQARAAVNGTPFNA